MKEFLEGHKQFQTSYFKKHEKELMELSEQGQHPKALFIGCADSRVVPNLVTQSKPGDLFVLRNIGNFVPPYGTDLAFHAMAAGIEYAVKILHVTEIIICGHTHCGAIEHLYQEPHVDTPHINQWLTLGEKAKSMAMITKADRSDMEGLLRLTEKLSLITQVDNLLTYPCVKESVAKEELFIHAWHYDITNGNIDYYDPEEYTFKPLAELLKQTD